ncbi:MAG: hypothetical protein UR30_C0005G0015 [Candidatus Peregrinibacteria bacterium GW2011_GWC2_33_13]|nr:MAG: hypothetical protein UR30_C0005G0015 [Candidatus Peregrinibacteria bacterium GW2011_GWC2_33_13]
MPITNYNERSWGIDLISAINSSLINRDIIIKHAGGENSLKINKKTLFPDVLIFGDSHSGKILQGWELKMPDTDIDNAEFIKNAKEKAVALGLNSFLLWNVSIAKLYKINPDKTLQILKIWDDLAFINNRNNVLSHKDDWINQLNIILTDLNIFFEQGEIRSSSIIDSISGNNIVKLILNNKNLLAQSYRNQTRINSDFEDTLSVWWDSIKSEHPQNEDKFNFLATINIFSWLNKFIFANLIKNSFRTARNIENIAYNTPIEQAISIIEEISHSCDFWNIFKRQFGDEYLPEIVWNDITEFNNFLIDSNIQDIEQSLWQKIFESLINEDFRKIYGQYSTPKPLADLLVNITIKNKELNVLDPCCGTGTIVRSVYDLKEKYQVPKNQILETIWASDKMAFPLQLATIALLKPDSIGNIMQIFQKDVVDLKIRDIINLSDPYTGDNVQRTIPAFDYIISNLPFVQFEDIEGTNSKVKEINEIIEELTEENYSLQNKSDLSYYIVFHLWQLLSDNGRLGLILSNSWLGTSAGNQFKNILQKFFHIESVITSGSGRWFQNAKVVTNILILNKKQESNINTEDLTLKTNFIILNKNINDLDINIILPNLRNFNNCINENIIKTSYSISEIKRLELLNVQWTALFADLSWLLNISSNLIKTNSLFEIQRGERRGWDALFYPEGEHGIENIFIKPVLKSSQSINSLIAEPDADAFCCSYDLDELNNHYNGAYNWVKSFENLTNGTGRPLPEVLRRSNINWYTMEPSTMADLVTSMNPEDRLFIARLQERSFVNQRLIRFTLKRNCTFDINLCHALLNSTIGMFFIESLGFGRGEGALDLSATKLKDFLYMLNPELLNETQKNNILEKFDILKNRNIKILEEELNNEDRENFDNAVYEAFNILEYKNNIKESLLCLYKIRKSVKT